MMRKQVLLLMVLAVTASAEAADFVKVRYSIWNESGKLIDSVAPGQAAVIAIDRMMPGWRAVVETMTVGETRRITVESEASGGKIPPGSAYEIETTLLELIDGPETPADLTAPPADAIRTRSGLAHKVLREGTGTTRPRRRSRVRVNYSGWTGDGRLFDSTVLRGQPAEFPLDSVIAGWTEGLQLMREGEIRRFWIPARLAYAGSPDKPQGMLVFDIELLQIY